ncbi:MULTISPECIES: GNAT family N-acetyltransferase [Salinibaculum]|uniref:GNAT family N-acetyltransferase n=1 Tax=Salinibaculum TaxID=2732368 RepID=UPI0030D30862
MGDRTIRRARPDDHDDVAAFTQETWSDHGVGDYLADVFPQWVESDGPRQRTAVVEVDGRVVGLCQGSLLTDDEGWLQGMRVAPDYRGAGHAQALVDHLLDWLRDEGMTVARNMIFGWNAAGMGQSHDTGLVPVTRCRWAQPEPGEVGSPPADAFVTVDDVTAAWRFWTHSDARAALAGLAFDTDRAWAMSELGRARLQRIAETGRVFAVQSGGTRGMAARTGTRERDGETIADYAVGAWDGTDAGRALFDAVRADAADCGADATRVCIPDTTRFVTDAAVARADHSDDSVFVFAADLTDR